jgi:hypothetical protein
MQQIADAEHASAGRNVQQMHSMLQRLEAVAAVDGQVAAEQVLHHHKPHLQKATQNTHRMQQWAQM